jgi:hypothetical protein
VRERQVDGFVAEGEPTAGEACARRFLADRDGVQADHVGDIELEHEIAQRVLVEDRSPVAPPDLGRAWGSGAGGADAAFSTSFSQALNS